MILLDWKKVSENIKKKLKDIFKSSKWKDSYITIFLLNNHKPSIKYVNLKRKFGEQVGMKVNIVTWNDIDNLDDVFKKLQFFNDDEKCKWIVFQLPLPDRLKPYQAKILSSVRRYKDIDWLWWVVFWLTMVDLFDFIPATPKAVINILKYYQLDDFVWKNITIIWQSNLVWKPLVLYLMKQWAEVFSFNKFVNEEDLIILSKRSDIIISATWNPHLIDERFIRDNKTQILIDVWWEVVNWKVVWDIDFYSIKDKVKAITPVPWWVWPVTVASLFENVVELDKIYEEIGDNFSF